MANNSLTVFGGQLPAHIAAMQEQHGADDITARNTVPSLLVTGKTWTMNVDGQKTQLKVKNSEGDEVPASVMRVVIVGHNADRGRTYFEGAYDPAQEAMPRCRSRDGKTPDADVSDEDKQNATCNGCPMSIKGSRQTDAGKPTTACSQHRLIAVASLNRLGSPLRLKLAMTSNYDKQSPHHARERWFAFQQYKDFLIANGVRKTSLVLTKMKFDTDAAYPKVLFQAERFLTEAEATAALEASSSEAVAALLTGGYDVAPAQVPAKAAIPAATAQAEDDEAVGELPAADEGEEDEAPAPAPKPVVRAPAPKPVGAVAPKPAAAPAKVAVAAAAPKAAPVKPKPVVAAPAEPVEATGVDDILGAWGGDSDE